MRDSGTRARHTALAHDTKDHDTAAPMVMVPLVSVLRAIPRLYPTQVPSRLLVAIVLPTFLLRLRKQSPRCRERPPRSIVCQTPRFPRTTTLPLSNQSRPREHNRKSRQSVCHLQARGHLLMPHLRSLRSQPLDVVPKHRDPRLMFLGDLRTLLDLQLACLCPILLLPDVATKISRMMVLETLRQSCQTIASAVSI
jgi:hypothetical protein